MQSLTIKTGNQNPNRPSEYIFNLPQSALLDNHSLSLVSVNFYNSLYNIEKTYRNNQKISIIWNANTSVQYDFEYNDAYYTVSDLNYAFQNFCLLNKLYMVGATSNVMYAEIITDPNRYKCMIIVNPLPTSALATAAGLTVPVGASWTLPTSEKCPQVIIDEPFGKLIGFNANTLPSTINNIKTTILGDKTPIISPVSSLTLTCSLIDSPYDNPSNTLKNIPITVAYGDQQVHNNQQSLWYLIPRQTYTRVTIEFLDSDNSPARLKDSEISVQLAIRNNSMK